MSQATADAAGLATALAGPATLRETVDVLGRVDFAPEARATLRGRFPGQVLEVRKSVGDRVTEGDVLARIESNDSLRTYEIRSPMDGVIVERLTNPGDVAGEDPLFTVGDPDRLIVDFHVFPGDLSQVEPGQTVIIRTVNGAASTESTIGRFLPTKESATQTVIARADLSSAGSRWVPGMTVRGDIVVATADVPLAVETSALQRFRGDQVVFAQEGETYEARSLRLGRQTPEWTEVLGGIDQGTPYVTVNSFLIKADIEKAGAGHAH
jgi:cobalt-zinc-cadmium efflux system membrane fusion protein